MGKYHNYLKVTNSRLATAQVDLTNRIYWASWAPVDYWVGAHGAQLGPITDKKEVELFTTSCFEMLLFVRACALSFSRSTDLTCSEAIRMSHSRTCWTVWNFRFVFEVIEMLLVQGG